MKKMILSSALAFALFQGVSFAETFAKVNGDEITEKDIAALMRAMPGVSFAQLPQDAKSQVINQAIERKLLIEQAKKDGVEKTKDFKNALESVKDDLALEVWMRQEMEKVRVSDYEIEKFYNDNKTKIVQPEVAKVRHSLVKSETEAKNSMSDVKRAGKNSLAKFEELAKSKSKDGSAQNGGDVGWIARGQVVPEFADAAFKLNKGQYTQTPVKTQFGYHVIYVEDKKPTTTLALKDVKGQIEQNLRLMKFQENVKKEGQELRKKAKVEITAK